MTQNPPDSQDLRDLQLSAYHYDLPAELIAQRPVSPRDRARLLVYCQDEDKVYHSTVRELAAWLPGGVPMVFNQSRVYPCRLFGQKISGGRAEVLVLSFHPAAPIDFPEGHPGGALYPCLVRTAGKKKVGDGFIFAGIKAVIRASLSQGRFALEFDVPDMLAFLTEQGKVPLPPYIRGGHEDAQDRADYQTIYAQDLGSVAAPTAGLHFTPDVFASLEQKGIRQTFVSLHVGPGTFTPVKAETITEHQMHAESFSVGREALGLIRRHWGELLTVGTTSLRLLETLARTPSLWQGPGPPEEIPGAQTDLFLYPGQVIHSSQALLTNFHLPGSSLLMLVSAMIGREKTLELYRLAREERYRFYSYGDAMLLLRGRA